MSWLGSVSSGAGGGVVGIVETQGRYNLVLPTVVDGDLNTLQLDVNGRLIVTGVLVGTVEGLIADNSPDTVKPIKMGAHYQTTLPTYVNGDIANLQVDINGRLITDTVGNVVDNQPDVGAPVKVGTRHNTTLPTYVDKDRADLQSDVNGRLIANVVGNIADNGVDSGNPVKVAGVHHTVLPTYVDGDRADLQVDSSGRLITVIAAGLTEVVGNVASEDADLGKPVKTGGKYDAVLPTYTDGDRTNTQADVNGRTLVNAVGNIADNAVDSGYPMKTGGKVNTTLPTYVDGDRADTQADTRGRTIVNAVGNIEDNDVDTGAPVKVGTKHNTALPTYGDGDRADLQSDVNGRLIANVVGNIADNAVDLGNPVKFGTKYNAVAPTYADGDRADAQSTDDGGLIIGGYNRATDNIKIEHAGSIPFVESSEVLLWDGTTVAAALQSAWWTASGDWAEFIIEIEVTGDADGSDIDYRIEQKTNDGTAVYPLKDIEQNNIAFNVTLAGATSEYFLYKVKNYTQNIRINAHTVTTAEQTVTCRIYGRKGN